MLNQSACRTPAERVGHEVVTILVLPTKRNEEATLRREARIDHHIAECDASTSFDCLGTGQTSKDRGQLY